MYQSDYDGNYYDDPRDDPSQQQNYPAPTAAPVPFPFAPGYTGPANTSPGWDGQNPPPGWEDANRPPGGFHYDQTTGSWVHDTGGTTPTTPSPGPGGSFSDLQPFGGGAAPDYSFLTGAPTFNAPKFAAPTPFSFGKNFQAPSAEDALNDPGYQFRLGQGRQALEQSAAGKGLLRSGGTLKDLLSYGQNMGSQEYGQVYDRRLNEFNTDYSHAANDYQTNYGVSRDVFDRTYQGAKDAFAPTLLDWQTKMQAQQRAADLQYNRNWDEYTYGNDYNQRNNLAVLDAGSR